MAGPVYGGGVAMGAEIESDPHAVRAPVDPPIKPARRAAQDRPHRRTPVPGVYETPKGIRGLDRRVWSRFKKAAREQNLPVGTLINEILIMYLDAIRSNKKAGRKK